MNIKARFTFVVRDAQGRVVKHISRRSHSYLKAFVDILWAAMGNQQNAFTTLDTSGASWNIFHSAGAAPAFTFNLMGANNDDLLPRS